MVKSFEVLAIINNTYYNQTALVRNLIIRTSKCVKIISFLKKCVICIYKSRVTFVE